MEVAGAVAIHPSGIKVLKTVPKSGKSPTLRLVGWVLVGFGLGLGGWLVGWSGPAGFALAFACSWPRIYRISFAGTGFAWWFSVLNTLTL